MNCPMCGGLIDVSEAQLLYDKYNGRDSRTMGYLTKAYCDKCKRYWKREEQYEMRLVAASAVTEDLAW